ncbi:endo-1,3-alpha-glucanase family glycosylhydrolase [Dinghuibacter silviterrae]|uniref:Glycosyl hydrolase family 71 n=1 Tax=Dinghuibacter silviterrae TaxID=1539049 RepID=A0A4R8DVM9_9BACT|nr:endo-1,3-alpha-glucanase family glycosylhydrolase [Dinghuibacter silviterrae]TDX02096.1 glycosyl hydrolase family 71 [Dinghuibacter silviterrae]
MDRKEFLYKIGIGVAAWMIPSFWNDPYPWDEVLAVARAFVAKESPDTVWPFERETSTDKKVFLHYFTPFPLSFDNKPTDQDYYRRQYMERQGENGKFQHVGGYLRERPLGAGTLDGPHWQGTNMAIDVLRAQALGADGFGVDLQQLDQGRYWDSVTALLGAAQASKTGFSILIEPDTDILKAVGPDHLVTTLTQLAQSKAAYRLQDGRLLLAPFAPEEQPVTFWQEVLDGLRKAGVPAALLPVFNNLRLHAKDFAPVSYGMSEWGNRDPAGVDGDAAIRVWQQLKGPDAIWMEPVAPQDMRPKVSIFWEASNTDLFRHSWMKAIREGAQYAHVVTWNDYSEATEIEPSSGTQFLFYDLSAYYIQWFKTGREPRITRDTIYYCHRRDIFQPGKPPLPDDKPLKLLGTGMIQNQVEMIALLTQPAFLEIHQGSQVRSVRAGAGLTVLKAPACLGRPLFRIVRDNAVVVEKASDWEIMAQTTAEDPLYVGGGSNRPFVVA